MNDQGKLEINEQGVFIHIDGKLVPYDPVDDPRKALAVLIRSVLNMAEEWKASKHSMTAQEANVLSTTMRLAAKLEL
jgi:hypothetical protein